MSISISLHSLVTENIFALPKLPKVVLKEQLSPNRLVKFKKCPKNFQYRALEMPSQIADDTAIEFGKMLHFTQERFYHKIPEQPSKEKILQIANLALEHEWLPRFHRQQRTAKKAVANFILFEQWRLSESKKENIPYKVVNDEGVTIDPIIETDIYSDIFHAIVDFHWEVGKMLLDFKFGKSDTVYDGYKIQLSVERHVLEYNDKEVDFTGFGFFRKSPQPTRVGTYHITVLKELRSRLLSAVENDYFPREVGPLCWYCEDFIRCWAEKSGFSLWSGILE